jgi:hypothetical protein
VTKKFGKGNMGGRAYHRPYVLELVLAAYYLVGWRGGAGHGCAVG